MDYTFSIGSDDPLGLTAADDRDAIAQAATYLRTRAAGDLRRRPEAVLTLMGPSGLLTRPSERLDEFLQRTDGDPAARWSGTLQPGDTNAPDCNGD